jgi:endonuclease/exonuclease/phosphatase family metal-dependent hydrolase
VPSRRVFLRGVAGVALVPGCAAHIGRGPARDRDDGLIRVLTLNVAHGRARAWMQSSSRGADWYRRNLDVVARMLAREKPDIVALQEAELGSRWAGMFDHVAYLGEKAKLDVVAATPFVEVADRFRYGTALLAHQDRGAEVLAHGGAGFRAHGRWAKGYTFARVRLESVELTVVSVHLDHASAAVRALQVAELADTLAEQAGPYVVMGDFNATWGSSGSPVRELARRLDLRAHDPEARRPSTYPFLHRRLDWILVSPDVEFVGYHVLVDDRLSDHRAVIADLRLV